MPVERYYLEEHLQEGYTYPLKGSEFHHLSHVLRARLKDEVELVNGKGSLGVAIVASLSKNEALLYVKEISKQLPYQKKIILAQAMPKLNRLDFIIEKGTELGVDEFWLFPGTLSVKKDLSSHQLERFHAITIASMKQCGRLFLPKIVLKDSLETWDVVEGTVFFGDVTPIAPTFDQMWRQMPAPLLPLTFAIGPESGFTAHEEDMLKHLGAHGVRIHENILRTDTAALVALSLMSHALMKAQ